MTWVHLKGRIVAARANRGSQGEFQNGDSQSSIANDGSLQNTVHTETVSNQVPTKAIVCDYGGILVDQLLHLSVRVPFTALCHYIPKQVLLVSLRYSSSYEYTRLTAL